MRNLSYIFLFFLFAFIPAEDEVLQKLRQQWQVYQKNQPQETIYLSLSEEVVAAGDTLWFSGFLRHHSVPSRVLYLELLSDQETIQKEIYHIYKGFTSGQMSIPDSLSSGVYQLRAYTQWMRNGDESSFFSRPLLVINPYDENPPVPGQRQFLSTQLQIEPEGGQWVQGLPARVRVSLGGEENLNLSGKILRVEDSNELSDIQLEEGLDMISLQPEAGASYRAEVYLPSGDTLRANLPPARKEGVSVMADLQSGRLNISAYTRGAGKHYLLVRSADSLLYSSLLEDTVTSLALEPQLTNSSLLEVAVLNEQAQVLAERLLYFPVRPLPLKIELGKEEYAAREEVTASLSLPEDVSSARLSVSVRKVNAPTQNFGQNIADPWSGYLAPAAKSMPQEWINLWLIGQESSFMPWEEIMMTKSQSPEFVKEDEYFLLSGRLTDASSGQALKNEMALLSVPGFNPHFDYDRTDSLGQFYIPVYDVYGKKKVVFHLQHDSLDANWSLEDKFVSINQQLSGRSKTPILTQQEWDEILEQYRQRNRIQTQYGDFFQEEEKDIPRKSRFYGEPNFEIRLDDYIALPDFVEVARELMPGIRLRKEGDHYVFSVFDVRTRTFLENPPALLLDGVLIDDPDAIVSLNPAEIERIETVNRRTYYGEYRFDGMIAVYTKEGNAFREELPPSARQEEVTFFTPLHAYQPTNPLATHQPDLRTLLMWKPGMILRSPEKSSISILNADELGEFEIVIEGVTTEGEIVHGVQRYQIIMKPLSQE